MLLRVSHYLEYICTLRTWYMVRATINSRIVTLDGSCAIVTGGQRAWLLQRRCVKATYKVLGRSGRGGRNKPTILCTIAPDGR